MSETGKTEFSPDEWRRHQSNKHVFTGLPRFEITVVDLQSHIHVFTGLPIFEITIVDLKATNNG